MPRKNPESLGPDRARRIAEECYGEVLAYCRRHAPAGHDAADLAQETFLRFVRAQREAVSPQEIESLAAAMLAEDARMRPVRKRLGLPSFVASQVHYILVGTWAAQVLIVAIMGALALMAGDADAIRPAIGILSAATVLAGVPAAGASKIHGVAELEYSCANNAAAVLVARLVVLGCSSALAVGVMVGVVASLIDANAFQVALWACPPFFLACAGSLVTLRRAAPNTATGVIGLFATPAAKVALLTPFSGLSYAYDYMVSYAVGPVVLDLPSALALLYACLIAVCVPLSLRGFRGHQVM